MDQQTKQELMSRHLARLRESIAPGDAWGDGDPIGRMIACWIIDIVADAREMEHAERLARAETLERLREKGRLDRAAREFTAGHHFTPTVDSTPERKTYDPKDVEVAITVEAMERLWEAEARVQVVDIESTTSAGRVGRFELVAHGDGSVWAWTPKEPGVTVMVVKPDPEPQVISLTDQEHPTVVVKP